MYIYLLKNQIKYIVYHIQTMILAYIYIKYDIYIYIYINIYIYNRGSSYLLAAVARRRGNTDSSIRKNVFF